MRHLVLILSLACGLFVAVFASGSSQAANTLCADFYCPVVAGTSTSVNATDVTVNLTVFTRGTNTTWHVEYGTGGSTSQFTSGSQTITGDANGSSQDAMTLTGLTASTTYSYKVIATNSAGSNDSDVGTFTTGSPCDAGGCPAFTGLQVQSIGVTTATVALSVFPRGSLTDWHVEYATDAVYQTTSAYDQTGAGTPNPVGPVDGSYSVQAPLTGLTPNTLYHYRVVASNSVGTSSTTDGTFQTLDPCTQNLCPDFTGVAVQGVSLDGGIVQANLYTRSSPTTWWVDYGATQSYGNSTAAVNAGTAEPQAIAATIAGMPYGSTIHYQFVGQNAWGTTRTPDQTFTANDPCALGYCPTISGTAATPSSLNGANVTTTIDTHGYAASWRVAYTLNGTTSYTAWAPITGDSTGPSAVAQALTGLTPGATYAIQIQAQNTYGTTTDPASGTTSYVHDVCSAPLSLCPDLTSDSATSLQWDTSSVVATIATKGIATTWHVRYGLDTSYGTTVDGPAIPADQTGASTVTAPISGLTGSTTYHYQVYGENAAGTFTGPDHTFTTPVQPDPCTIGLCAPGIDHSAITPSSLNGADVTAGFQTYGLATTWQVEWGTDGVTYPNTTAVTTVPVDPLNPTAIVDVSLPVSGLTPAGAYHFRILVTNTNGTTTSADIPYVHDVCSAPLSLCPELTADSATNLVWNGASIVATIATKGLATTWHVRYGTTTSYGSTADGPAIPGAQIGATTIAADLTGLTGSTTYHYQVYGENAASTFVGPDHTFTTAAQPNPCTIGLCAPGIDHSAVTTTTLDGADVTAAFQTWGLATQWQVQWGMDGVTYPNTTGWITVPTDPANPNALVNVSTTLSGLTPHGAYHMLIDVKNANGTTTSADIPYVQDVCGADLCPELGGTFTQDPAATEVTVVADIYSKKLATTWQVEYWDPSIVGGPHTTVDGPAIPPDQTGATRESFRLTGLTANTTYDYIVHGQNAAGSFDGSTATFFTGPPPDPCTVGLCPAGGLTVTTAHSTRVTLDGEIYTYDSPTTWTVKYSVHVTGQTPTYADGSVDGTPLPGVQGGATPVTIDIPGLTPTTTYDYEIVATNGVGTATFGAGQFTTGPPFANSETLNWQLGPDLPKPWYAATIADVTATNGTDRMYVLGNDPLGRVYSLDPRGTSDEWRLEPGTAPYYTQEEGSIVVGQTIYLLGSGHYIGETSLQGFLTQTYDTTTGTWGMASPLPDQNPRFGAMVAKVGNKIYLYGGRTVPGPGSAEFYRDAWVLNIDTGVWSPTSPLPIPVSDAAVSAGNDGRIYFFGGVNCGGAGSFPGTCTPGSIISTVQIYDPATDTWSTGTSLPSPVYGAAASTVGGGILVVGGLDQLPTLLADGTNVYPTSLKTVLGYVYKDARWLNLTPNINPHEEHAVIGSGRELWVIGGRDAQPMAETEYITAPIIVTAVPSPAQPNGANGWYVTQPSLQVEATDGIYGPDTTTTGFGSGPYTTQPYSGPFSVAAPDGIDVFHYSGNDNAGNASGDQTKTIKVDTVAPAASFSANVTGYVVNASDATSGVASVAFSADGPNGGPLLTVTGAPYVLPFAQVPAGATTLTAVVTDVAGNTTTITTPVSVPTTLTMTAPATVTYHGSATLSGTLRDLSGNLLAGQTVTFAIGSQTCQGVTDGNGVASCTIASVTADPGPANATATFAQTGLYLGSSASASTTVTQAAATVVDGVSGPVLLGSTATLTGTLTEQQGGAPIAGATLTLTLGTASCTATTNAAGVATCTVVVPGPLGPTPTTASFAGNTDYASAPTDTRSALVYAAPGSGGFVVGDRSDTGSVFFWGDQWWKQNSLSGGRAPSDFKGFASNVPTLDCGSTWTSRPGDSPPPPAAPLPAYMAVIVSSRITKSGATESGNIAQIVIVKTDGGYNDDPGHAGTGMVVATLCSTQTNGAELTPTTLAYTGATSVRSGSPAVLSATLTTANGPVTGATVFFTVAGQTCSATTDESGRASCSLTVGGAAGTSYPVSADFFGDGTYLASSDSSSLTITGSGGGSGGESGGGSSGGSEHGGDSSGGGKSGGSGSDHSGDNSGGGKDTTGTKHGGNDGRLHGDPRHC